MSETDTYYRYNHERVLLGTARIYRPELAPAVVQLTGAQVEMLRNMTQYLNRPNTYVEEYEVDKYLTPNAAQFDDIQAIVADLEEKLMGNENVLWGYKDTYSFMDDTDYTSTGFKLMDSGDVPPGKVYVITAVTARFTTGTSSAMYIYLGMGSGDVMIAAEESAVVGVPLSVIGSWPLKAGQQVRVGFNVTAQPCHAYVFVSGYMMDVPE